MKKWIIGIAFFSAAAFGAIEWGNLTVVGNLITQGSNTFSGLTATTVPYLDASKVLTSSAVTPTELGYLSGVTSAIQTQLDAAAGVPTGTVIMFGGSSCPTNYLALDGSAIDRTTYSALFALLSTTYGVGDGSTTFNLPDTRGVFIRGSGSQTISSITYTGTRGTTQGDQFQGHYHSLVGGTTSNPLYVVNFTGADGGNAGGSNSGTVRDQFLVTSPITDGSNGTPRVGSETRPANVVLLYCIRI